MVLRLHAPLAFQMRTHALHTHTLFLSLFFLCAGIFFAIHLDLSRGHRVLFFFPFFHIYTYLSLSLCLVSYHLYPISRAELSQNRQITLLAVMSSMKHYTGTVTRIERGGPREMRG